jgi:hypothetical protein
MTTLHSLTRHAQPVRADFRPLKEPPTGTYRIREGNRLEVTLTKHGRQTTYHVFAVSTDIGGAAFRWHKLDGSGDVYDVLMHGTDSSCTCAGYCYTGGCKHLHCTKKLLDLGVLNVAPDSAACEDDDAA